MRIILSLRKKKCCHLNFVPRRLQCMWQFQRCENVEINVHAEIEELVVGKMSQWLRVHTALGEDPD